MPILTAARTLAIPYPSAEPFFGGEPAELVWPGKSSAGVLSYGLNLASWVGTINGAPIGTPAVTISPTGGAYDLAASAAVIFGNIIGFTAASGLPGTGYSVEIGVQCDDGSAESFLTVLPVNFAAPPTLPPIALFPPGEPPMAVILNKTAGPISAPFVITAQFTGFSVVHAPNNYCILPPNPGVPVEVINQTVGNDELIVLPPNGSTSINGLADGQSVAIQAPIVAGIVQPTKFVYGTVIPTPTQIEAY